MEARKARGEDVGVMAQFAAMKNVAVRIKDEMQKEQQLLARKVCALVWAWAWVWVWLALRAWPQWLALSHSGPPGVNLQLCKTVVNCVMLARAPSTATCSSRPSPTRG